MDPNCDWSIAVCWCRSSAWKRNGNRIRPMRIRNCLVDATDWAFKGNQFLKLQIIHDHNQVYVSTLNEPANGLYSLTISTIRFPLVRFDDVHGEMPWRFVSIECHKLSTSQIELSPMLTWLMTPLPSLLLLLLRPPLLLI